MLISEIYSVNVLLKKQTHQYNSFHNIIIGRDKCTSEIKIQCHTFREN